jgi:DNA-binding transcriptional ArsR family regulator
MHRSCLSELGGLIADESRAQLLMAMLDGRAHTGGELARRIGIAPSTASEHLAKLCDAGMLRIEAQGRHRYFRLAGPDIAEMLEPLLGFLPKSSSAPTRSKAPSPLLAARRCYDHLAGEVAVQLYENLLSTNRLNFVDERPVLTERGASAFDGLGIDVEALAKKGRPLVRNCLDWTERRHHLAGSVAAGLLEVMLQDRWMKDGSRPRALVLTSTGRDALFTHFDLDFRERALAR